MPNSKTKLTNLGHGYSLPDITLSELANYEEQVKELDPTQSTNAKFMIDVMQILGVTPEPSNMPVRYAREVYSNLKSIIAFESTPLDTNSEVK